jgi:4-aminobutyrate aminotransferase
MVSRYPRIIVRPPGPRARAIVKRDEAAISPIPLHSYPLVIASGEGCIIKDVDGNEYIDFNAGLGTLNVGHNHPTVTNAIKEQCDRFLYYPKPAFFYDVVVSLAEKLLELTPGRFQKKVCFGSDGAEAVEAAIKLSKWHTRKHRFIAFLGGFHGRSLGTLSLSGSKTLQRKHYFPLLPGISHVPYPYCYRCPFKMEYPDCGYWCIGFIDEVVLQKSLPHEEVAAIVFESIQGDSGCLVPPPEYFRRLKKVADKHGFLLVDDETRATLGRTGKWFAIEHWKVEPDIVCVANGLASGIPLSATVARSRLMDWEGESHASTFGGNPLACVAAVAGIDVIRKENLLAAAEKTGAYILKRMQTLKEEQGIVGDVRGKGLMLGIELVDDKETKKPGVDKARETVRRCWKRGIPLVTDGHSTLRITPPLNIPRELVDAGLEIIEDVIKEIEKGK